MFRYFENLLDPYQDYTPTNSPPKRLLPFMWSYLRPFKRLFWYMGLLSVLVAFIEVALIFYLGRLIDLMSISGPTQFWALHGFEMLAVCLFLLVLRPALHALNVLLMNNTMLPNVGTIFRYRGHRHVMRQSVGWFEDDFAGRIANRIMQVPPAAGEVVFQIFDALTFVLAYVIGALILLGDIDF